MGLPTDVATESKPPRALRNALLSATVQQAIAFVVTSAMLDGGATLLRCMYAFVAYWVGFAILMIRRRKRLEEMDLKFVQYGYLALCVFSILISPLIWHLRGVAV